MTGIAAAMDVAALLLLGRLVFALAVRPRPAVPARARSVPGGAGSAEVALDEPASEDVTPSDTEGGPDGPGPDDAGRFAAMALIGVSLILLSIPLWSG